MNDFTKYLQMSGIVHNIGKEIYHEEMPIISLSRKALSGILQKCVCLKVYWDLKKKKHELLWNNLYMLSKHGDILLPNFYKGLF